MSLGYRVLMVTKVTQRPLVRKEMRVFLVLLGPEETKDRLARRAQKEELGLLDFLVLQDQLVYKVFKGFLDHLVLRGIQEMMKNVVLQGQ